MSVRLQLVSRWMPRFLMVRELEKIRARTDAALDALLAKHDAPPPHIPRADGGTLEARRAAMAQGHELRVRALIEKLGRDEAVRTAREALFTIGLEIGREAKGRLGVGDSKDDLIKAAGVMYRVLGINFSVIDGPEGGRIEVLSCALAKGYSHEACLMLSAVDEGVVSGLNPRAEMRFTQRITGGSARCVAEIKFGEGE